MLVAITYSVCKVNIKTSYLTLKYFYLKIPCMKYGRIHKGGNNNDITTFFSFYSDEIARNLGNKKKSIRKSTKNESV